MSTQVQGVLNLSDTTSSGGTAASSLDLYAQNIASFMMARIDSANNATTSLQSHVGINHICVLGPNSGTSVSSFNSNFTSAGGTISNPTPSSGSLLTSIRSLSFNTTATAGTVSSVRSAVLECWRGNAAGLGGFFFVGYFGTSVLATNNRAFIGLVDITTAPTNINPLTSTTPGKLGMAIAASTGNWSFVNNVSGTAPTATDLGTNFPVNTTNLYRLSMYCAPNGSTIFYQVDNMTTGNSTSGSVSTNIPTNTTFLGIQAWITNNATAAAANLLVSRIYLESDI